MLGRGRFLALALVVSLMLELAASGLAAAKEPASVTLIYFRGTPQAGGVVLEWATASETDTVGFRVERAQATDGPYTEADSIGFVRSEGDSLMGATYGELDTDAIEPGATYYYLLIEVELSGAENIEGPIAVTRPGDDADATPTVRGDSGPTRLPTATPFPSTNTPVPTSTPVVSTNGSGSTGSPGSAARSGSPLASVTVGPVVQLGQQVPTATPDSGYPAPAQEGSQTSPTVGQTPYPAPAFSEPVDVPQEVITPIPRPEFTQPEVESGQPAVDNDRFSPIGQGGESADQGGASQRAATRSVGTTLLLWLGFFAALLIFAAGVFGSIILYARRSSREH